MKNVITFLFLISLLVCSCSNTDRKQIVEMDDGCNDFLKRDDVIGKLLEEVNSYDLIHRVGRKNKPNNKRGSKEKNLSYSAFFIRNLNDAFDVDLDCNFKKYNIKELNADFYQIQQESALYVITQDRKSIRSFLQKAHGGEIQDVIFNKLMILHDSAYAQFQRGDFCRTCTSWQGASDTYYNRKLQRKVNHN